MEVQIIDYKSCSNMTVKFADGTIVENVPYYRFIKGNIMNYNIPNYLGVGFRGYGIFKTKNGTTRTEEYTRWGAMLTRCYSEKLNEHENYIGCSVCYEWLNYQNFALWYSKHKYVLPDGEKIELDKDIKFKNNKIYSPETCLLVPKKINSIILNRHNDRGQYLLGVSYLPKLNKYSASCQQKDKKSYLGLYETEDEAFEVYKKAKEQEIRKIANDYKPYIPQEVFEAIINYSIDKND